MDKKDVTPAPPDPIIQPIGDLGKWQLFVCLLVFLSKFGTGWHTLTHIFLAAKTDYKCVDPANVTDKCSEDCNKLEFDRSTFEQTIIMEWDLTCDNTYLSNMSQALVMFGIMVGSLVFGMMSDKYGRRLAFLTCCFLQLISSLLVSLVNSFWLYCIVRFIVAVATGGTMVTSFVIIMEIVGKSKREIMSVLYQIPFNLGHATLPAFAYFLREWRYFHLAIAVCHVVYIPYLCFIPESPRWLFTQGKIDRAADVLEKAAACNKMPTETVRADLEEAYRRKNATSEMKKGTMLDLFRHPNLRIKTLAMAFNWLVVCLTYYGVSQYVSGLTGDIFLNVALGACLGVPGTIICVPLTKYLGRKITLFSSNIVSAISLLLIAAVPGIEGLSLTILASIGIFGAAVTFPNAYLYAGEIFPTVVRNSGVGFSSLIGRFGSICAPFVTQTASLGDWVPPLIFGVFSLAAALSVLLLPETKGHPLPDTIEEGELFGKKVKPAA